MVLIKLASPSTQPLPESSSTTAEITPEETAQPPAAKRQRRVTDKATIPSRSISRTPNSVDQADSSTDDETTEDDSSIHDKEQPAISVPFSPTPTGRNSPSTNSSYQADPTSNEEATEEQSPEHVSNSETELPPHSLPVSPIKAGRRKSSCLASQPTKSVEPTSSRAPSRKRPTAEEKGKAPVSSTPTSANANTEAVYPNFKPFTKPSQLRRYENLQTQSAIYFKIFDFQSLSVLTVEKKILEYFSNIGWSWLLNFPKYKMPIRFLREFYASFSSEIGESSGNITVPSVC